MDKLYIYHHLGLGDHIICNGLVRHFAKENDNVFVFCKDQYRDNVEYMYRDSKNIHVISLDSDHSVNMYINNNDLGPQTLIVGHSAIDSYMINESLSFDRAFYRMAGIDFNVRFNEFYIERDFDKENELYEKLNPSNEPYIFVHDDATRGFAIDMGKVRSDLKIIRNDNSYLVFDYYKIIDQAEEVHVMESSLSSLINSYRFNNTKLIRHHYIRGYGPLMTPAGINEYEIIN